MGLPVYNANSIQDVPVYIKQRTRLVYELMKEASITMANNSKAMGVIDVSRMFPLR